MMMSLELFLRSADAVVLCCWRACREGQWQWPSGEALREALSRSPLYAAAPWQSLTLLLSLPLGALLFGLASLQVSDSTVRLGDQLGRPSIWLRREAGVEASCVRRCIPCFIPQSQMPHCFAALSLTGPSVWLCLWLCGHLCRPPGNVGPSRRGTRDESWSTATASALRPRPFSCLWGPHDSAQRPNAFPLSFGGI